MALSDTRWVSGAVGAESPSSLAEQLPRPAEVAVAQDTGGHRHIHGWGFVGAGASCTAAVGK